MRGAHGALRNERVLGDFRSGAATPSSGPAGVDPRRALRAFDDDTPLGEMTVPPDAYQWRSQRARLGFWPLAARGLLFSVCVIGVLVAVTWATGWAAVEIDALRGGR